MKKLIVTALVVACTVMLGYSSRARAALYHVYQTVLFSNKTVAAEGDTTFIVPVTLTEAGSVVTPSKYSERPHWIRWEIMGKHLSRTADSTYRVTIRAYINNGVFNVTNPGSFLDSLTVVAPWSDTEQGRRGFIMITPAVADSFSVRITNPHPVLEVDSLTVGWNWIRVF